jgi:NADPH2:quinone reductase
VAERVLELTDGKKCPVVYDGGGQGHLADSLDCAAQRGLMVSFGNASGAVDGVNLGILRKGLAVRHPADPGDYANTPERLQAMADELFGMITAGKIKVEINQRYPWPTRPRHRPNWRRGAPPVRPFCCRDANGG